MAKKPTPAPTISKHDVIVTALTSNQSYSEIRDAFINQLGKAPSSAAVTAGYVRKLKLSKNRKLINAVSKGTMGLQKAIQTLKAAAANGDN